MSGEYDRPFAAPGGLRLHLNENTAGCSPAVFATLQALTGHDAAWYPDYDAAQLAVARTFGLTADHVVLTNGLDEGILAATGAALRDRSAGGIPEVLGVAPAFDMYEVCTDALGGQMITVRLGADFEFPWDGLRRAITDRTRIVFLTNPHNPTGQTLSLTELRRLAAEIAPVLLFVDEAYADFSGETLLDAKEFSALPNLLVGRTFAKAYGLAGLRVGAVLGLPETVAPVRRVVPPYSLNAYATAALPVALADTAYRAWYLEEAAESKRLLTVTCAQLGLRTWPSATNFMLVYAGARAAALVDALAARQVFVRNRSHEPGCDGCIRMTTGVVEHTRRLIAALEEAWCGAVR
jgi:histidinol-phosphate aminotransferase